MSLRGKHIGLLAIGCWLLAFTGCEVIGESERLIEVAVAVDNGERRHVLVEYTGFRCVNCPKAAEAAAALQNLYGERLIVVGMHPASNPFTQGAYDYTCEEADVYYRYMGGVATTPFPTGNVDFLSDGQTWLHDYPEWPTLVAQEMSKTADVYMSTQTSFDDSNRSLSVATTLYAPEMHECRVAVWLVEDSVQGVQALPDGSVDKQYYHRHVLRGTIGEPWGETVSVTMVPKVLTNITTLPEAWNPEHCSVVVVALNGDKEIVNASEERLKN